MEENFSLVNAELERVGAMSAAFAVINGNPAGMGTNNTNRLMFGVGTYGGKSAFSIGYSHATSDSFAINFGFATTTEGDSMGGGAVGFSW